MASKRSLISALCFFAMVFGVMNASAQSPVLATTGSTVLGFLHSAQAKLIYVDRGFLYFIDFGATSPAITKMVNTSGAVAPMISPDGNYATYLTGLNSDGAVPGKSTAWICPLAAGGVPVSVADSGYNPRFVYDAVSPTVLYSTCGYAGADAYSWDGCGTTVKRACPGGVPGALTTLWSGGSYFGGLSYDGRYLCTGEQSLNAFMLDLQNSAAGPARLMHVTFSQDSGSDTTIDMQTCNPSISSSRVFSSSMMFLDFGQFTPGLHNPVLGSLWGMHHRIFVEDISGKFQRIFNVEGIPKNVKGRNATTAGDISEIQFDHPEWSNHPYYAAANMLVDRLRGSSGAWSHSKLHEAIYLINLKDSSFVNVVQATDTLTTYATNLQWPWLWVDVAPDFASTESTTWLNDHPNAVIMPNGRSYIRASVRVENGVIVSDLPLASIAVHDMAGRLLTKIEIVSRVRSYLLLRSALSVRGMGFLRVTTIDGNHQTIRLVPSRQQ